MMLKEEFIKKGEWLFRWRSYLPLFLFIFLLFSFIDNSKILINDRIDKLYEYFCLLISFLGLFIRIITIGFTPKNTSGRNKKVQKAEVLNTTGIYSMVRNPLYLGNYFVLLGMMMYPQSIWLAIVASLIFWLYYERIIFKEEDFLENKFQDEYIKWAENVSPFIPKFGDYKPIKLKFSFKNILKREYLTFFLIITIFTILDILKNYLYYGTFILELDWIIVFGIGLIIFIILRILVKMTNILKVKGR